MAEERTDKMKLTSGVLCIGKYLKRIVGILASLLIFEGVCSALNYIYVTPEDSKWERVCWHNFYEDEGKIDNLYLGSSHVYTGINPSLLDKLTGKYNFNLSSPDQVLNGTFYLLKEADKNNKLSHVYVELFYMCCTKDTFDSDMDMVESRYYRNWQNTDQMKLSLTKMQYMLSIAGVDKYVDILFPFCRYREKLDDWSYIKETIESKQADNYLAYKYYNEHDDGNGYDEYRKQGYFYSTRVFKDTERLYQQTRILNENPMGETSEQYLRKIITYCQKRNIPITLFIVPIDDLRLISTINYDAYVNQVREIAKEYKVDFYDFNLAKEEYLPIKSGEYFKDIHHLNHTGSDMFTSFFNEIVSRNAHENMKYFYNSYAEKLNKTKPKVYGLYFSDSEIIGENKERIRTLWIASNREEEMEYRIYLLPDEGEKVLLQDFSKDKRYEVIWRSEEHGVYIVEARMEGEAKVMQTLEIAY